MAISLKYDGHSQKHCRIVYHMRNLYEKRYDKDDYYWGLKPSSNCDRVLELKPPERPVTLLDVGCGEGRDAVYFATKGYTVTTFDASPIGIQKAMRLANNANVSIDAFVADINDFRLSNSFDVIFSTGVLQYFPEEHRAEIIDNYRNFTNPMGLNALSVFVKKPFIEEAPDHETTSFAWFSGELSSHYHDWRVEFTTEEIFNCMSSGLPHQHAISKVIARKEASQPFAAP